MPGDPSKCLQPLVRLSGRQPYPTTRTPPTIISFHALLRQHVRNARIYEHGSQKVTPFSYRYLQLELKDKKKRELTITSDNLPCQQLVVMIL